MDYSNLRLYKMMQAKMAYHSERQDVLAHNIANADTPGFRPKDIEEPDFSKLLEPKRQRLAIKRTSPEHQVGVNFKTPSFNSEQTKKHFELKPMKNGVTVEQQMMNMSHNAFDFQTTTSLYQKTTGLFKAAIGDGG